MEIVFREALMSAHRTQFERTIRIVTGDSLLLLL